MKKIPILSTENESRCCLGNEYLPLNYMGEFSLMGIQVRDLSEAVSLLAGGLYPVRMTECGAEVTVNDAEQLMQILGLFQHSGLAYSLSDVAHQVYRG